MALTKGKLGSYLVLSDLRNSDGKLGEEDVRGISTGKVFISTKADLNGVSLSNYKIVLPGMFAYVADTSRRGDKISLAYNNTQESYIVSSISTVFSVSDETRLLSDYLFIFFNRPEFDRYSRFNSWGSAREAFDWETMCDIDIDLPDLPTQQKFVNVYNATVKNQKSYEKGLTDLKLTCDAYVEDLRRKIPCEKIGPYIERYDVRNGENGTKNVMSISTTKEFNKPSSKVDKNNLKNYKVVHPRSIGFVQTTNNEKVFTYAFNNTSDDIVISAVDEVFRTDESKLLPEYLSLFFNRTEFDRYARFHSWGSARETFTWNDLINVMIPIPKIAVQKSIVDLYVVYKKRKEISERLKTQIKDLCPILIRGSIEEALKEA